MAIVKLSWSGGKDSTAAALLHLERGDKLKMVCYIPMFTKEIPLILKSHYEFILRAADYFRSRGAEVYLVHGMTYFDYVLRKKTKGDEKGLIMGFPVFKTRGCGFKNYSKIPALESTNVGDYDYQDIGIAFDEVDRHTQLSESKRSILFELKCTEKMAKELCLINGLLSPLYEMASRDGCTLCPHAPSSRRRAWFNEYPQAVPLVLYLQEQVIEKNNLISTPQRTPLRNYKWFIEPNDQLGIAYQEEYIIN